MFCRYHFNINPASGCPRLYGSCLSTSTCLLLGGNSTFSGVQLFLHFRHRNESDLKPSRGPYKKHKLQCHLLKNSGSSDSYKTKSLEFIDEKAEEESVEPCGVSVKY